MSATEFAFLAFGLVLGVASGILLAAVIRSRPASPRQVRLTITPGSVAVRRRPQTLASAEPADHSAAAIGTPPAPTRTPVRPGVGPGARAASDDEPLPAMPASLTSAARTGERLTLSESAVGIPIDASSGEPGLAEQLVAARSGEAAGARSTRNGSAAAATGSPASSSVASEDRPFPLEPSPPRGRRPGASSPSGEATTDTSKSGAAMPDRASATGWGSTPAGDGGGGAAASTPAATGPCAEARQLAEERCSIAERTKAAAQESMTRLLAARREYDEHRRRLESAESAVDPRAIRDAKDAAQQAFRAGRGGTADTEAAARDWLHEINRINAAARDAQHVVDKERQVTRDLLTQLDRLELETDAARIADESAEVACRDAREAVARCEEAAQQPVAPAQSSWAPGGPADLSSPLGSGSGDPALAVGGGDAPVILRLVRGDRSALERTVADLGGADPTERRNWQHRLTDLVDAIVARAIEAAFLDFPDDHRFWGPFTRSQGRDIVAALASLGFRFDGLGGWAEERIPTQRDLSLAVGYAGLDPMRIRHWPTEPEMADLFRTAFVAADEWLAGAASELHLGEMVDALGRRADDLADVWNDWGRVRPALLATD